MSTITIRIPTPFACCNPCALGAILNATFAGITRRDECLSDVGSWGFVSQTLDSLSFSGVFAVSEDTPNISWVATGGSWTGTQYDPSTICEGEGAPFSGSFTIGIGCADGVLTVIVSTGSTGGWRDVQIFGGTGALGEVIANGLPDSGTSGATGGSVLVE